MRGNRKTDSRPEIHLRSALHRNGYRFRKNVYVRVGDVRTYPDILFTRHRVAVFVDGCFWHGCPVHGVQPQSNTQYWSHKLQRNMARDRVVTQALKHAGWEVLRLWEHVPLLDAVRQVEAVLARPSG